MTDEEFSALEGILAWHVTTCRERGLPIWYDPVQRAIDLVRRERHGRPVTLSLERLLAAQSNRPRVRYGVGPLMVDVLSYQGASSDGPMVRYSATWVGRHGAPTYADTPEAAVAALVRRDRPDLADAIEPLV